MASMMCDVALCQRGAYTNGISIKGDRRVAQKTRYAVLVIDTSCRRYRPSCDTRRVRRYGQSPYAPKYIKKRRKLP